MIATVLGGFMEIKAKTREVAREIERVGHWEKQQARLDRLIAEEERRRQEIQRRLQQEIRRLELLRHS